MNFNKQLGLWHCDKGHIFTTKCSWSTSPLSYKFCHKPIALNWQYKFHSYVGIL